MLHVKFHTHIPECNSSATLELHLCSSIPAHPPLTATLTHCNITLIQEDSATLRRSQSTGNHYQLVQITIIWCKSLSFGAHHLLGHDLEIALGADIVARHRRSYVRGDVVYDPLHYLSLLEKKPGALDQAAPLRGWKLDPAFDTLRRLLEARFGPRGKREYIQVLRLHEDFPEPQVAAAVRDAVKRRLIGFDAVKHLLLARIERRPVHLDLARYPHLPQPFVAATRSADYASLLAGGADHG